MNDPQLPPGDDDLDLVFDAAIADHQAGRSDAAAVGYHRVLAARPDDPDALNLIGVLHVQAGRHGEAVPYLERAAAADPNDSEFRRNLARALVGVSRFAEARDALRESVRLNTDSVDAWRELGDLCQRGGAFEEALAAFRQVRRLTPGDAAAANNEGVALRHLGRFDEAVRPLSDATSLSPTAEDAWINLGRTYEALGRDEAMADAFAALVRHTPDRFLSHMAHALALQKIGRFADAVQAVGRAAKLKPKEYDAHLLLAKLFVQMREYGAAAIAYSACVDLKPDDPTAYIQQAAVLVEAGSCVRAVPILENADERFPPMVGVKVHLARAHERLGDLDAAVRRAREAVDLEPNDPVPLTLLGHLLATTGDQAAAEPILRHAVACTPWLPMAAASLGSMLTQRGELAEGLALYRQVLDRPGEEALHHVPRSNYLFYLNGDPDVSPEAAAAEHRAWQTHHAPPPDGSPFPQPRDPDRVLRVGYISPDWRGHSVAYFMQPILTAHDRSKVHVVVYDSVLTPDELTKYFHTLADEWHRIVGLTDEAVVNKIRDDRIDILVDLSGHTGDNRLRVFARRPAPVQVTYLGYPNTTGLEQMDYRLTDALADPPGPVDAWHSETLVRLPNTFLCYKPPHDSLTVGPLPAETNGFVTFGSFNSLSKLHGGTAAAWSRVLLAVPGSKLMLKANGLGDSQTQARLYGIFAGLGIGADRLVFAPRTKFYGDHMLTYDKVDIALDSFPYNGTTTTCEALWMGVPVVTLAGRSHAGRVGVSLLTNVNLPELIADSVDDYVATAVRLAADIPALVGLRNAVRPRMASSPLMDAASFTQNLEAAYRDMWHAYCSRPDGLTPAN